MTPEQARALTTQAQTDLGSLAATLADLYAGEAWKALGYASWGAYTDAELSLSQWRLPKGADRKAILSTLREAGMSLREIESATGLGKSTIHRMLTVPNGTPERVHIPATVDELGPVLAHLDDIITTTNLQRLRLLGNPKSAVRE